LECIKEKAKVDVQQPAVIAAYNHQMGGVDLLDRFLSNYRPFMRSKKWWWPLFVNGRNMVVVAAWRAHVEVGGLFDQLEFCRHVMRALVQSTNKVLPSSSGPASHPVADVRYDGINHHLPSEQQGRCRLCQKNVRLYCEKCMVPLHHHCEKQYYVALT